jgi:dolichol-phosphate mannosyltransferase
MKCWVVLPAYNESENLPALLNGFHTTQEDTYNLDLSILVIDDASTDGTGDVARRGYGSLPVEVFRNDHNLGLADTFMRGMTLAADRAGDDDIILCMDADNTHSPGLTVRMIRDIREGRDVVIASRYQPGAVVRGVPFLRRMLSYGMSILFRCMAPIEGVKDYSCGYRAYRAEFLKKALAEQGQNLFIGEGFSCMAGILLALRRQGAICGEVPIILRYDQKAGGSKMKVLRTIGRTLRLLVRERLGRPMEHRSEEKGGSA